MAVKQFFIRLCCLEIWLQLRFGRRQARPVRRYRPTSRNRLGNVRNELLHHLADTFSPDRTS